MYTIYAIDHQRIPHKIGDERLIDDAIGNAEYIYDITDDYILSVEVYAKHLFGPVARVSCHGIHEFNPAY